MNALATADQIKLAVDEAFYNALQTFACREVAEQTVSARQLVSDQITTLFQNKLRSQLDVSFADANLAQSKLLLLDAQNNYQAALSHALADPGLLRATAVRAGGYRGRAEAAARCGQLNWKTRRSAIGRKLPRRAMNIRPPSISRKQSAICCSPRIEALGVVGRTPYSSTIAGVSPFTTWYGAVGVNVNVPIFNGFLYPARSREAGLRAQAADEQLRDLKDRIANDVRTSWLSAITAYNRIGVSQQFVDQTNLALQPVADPLQPGPELDCGVKPGATAADGGANPVRCRQVSVPHCAVGTALPDCGALSLGKSGGRPKIATPMSSFFLVVNDKLAAPMNQLAVC